MRFEFVTIMWFDSFDAMRPFAGEEYEMAVVPPRARALLSSIRRGFGALRDGGQSALGGMNYDAE